MQNELEGALTVKFTRASSQATSRAQLQQIAELLEAQEDLTAQVDAAREKLKEAHNLRVQLEKQIKSLEDKLSESQLAAKRPKADLQRARDSMLTQSHPYSRSQACNMSWHKNSRSRRSCLNLYPPCSPN